jgi:hypothetical protein
MLDIFVAKIVLKSAGIVAVVGELVPASVPQHVRMNWKRHLGGLTEALDKPMEADWAHWSTALGNEHEGVGRMFATQLTERSHFITTDRVNARDPTFRAMNVHAALGQLDLMPLEIAHL